MHACISSCLTEVLKLIAKVALSVASLQQNRMLQYLDHFILRFDMKCNSLCGFVSVGQQFSPIQWQFWGVCPSGQFRRPLIPVRGSAISPYSGSAGHGQEHWTGGIKGGMG